MFADAPTIVLDEQSLKTAVSTTNFNIQLSNDITVNSVTTISRGGTIDGCGHTITVPVTGTNEQGVNQLNPSNWGVFSISASGSANTVNLKNMHIKGGDQTAVVINSSAYANIENIQLTNAKYSSGGGGLNNMGYLLMKNCSIMRNLASYGGGMLNSGSGVMIAENCSLSENRSLNLGGGAFENNGYMFLISCTISNNQSGEIGGAINNYGGTLYVIQSTITGNISYWSSLSGGGIGQHGGSVRIINSIIANNYELYGGRYIDSDVGIVWSHAIMEKKI